MKEIRSFLLSTLLLCFTLFSFTGCEDKKVEDSFIPVENTTEVFTQKDKGQQEEKRETQKTIKKEVKIGRNDPCPCGSGKKYKKCCGKN